MRVLVLTTSFPAFKGHHQSPFIYELARHLAKKHKVHVVCPLYKESKKRIEKLDGFMVHRFRSLGIDKLTQGGGIPSNLKRSLWAWVHLLLFMLAMKCTSKRVVKMHHIDVVHSQWALSGVVGATLGKPTVLTTRGAAVNMAVKSGFMRFILKKTLRRTDMITPNNMHHKDLLRKLGVLSDKIEVVPNGIAMDRFKPRDKGKGKRKLGLSGSVVLFVGWLIERKGLRYLIRAMEKINGTLVVVGDGAQREEMEDLAGRNVKFFGNRSPSEIPAFMDAADVLVLPSLSEGRPNVLGEAMASGVPIVATGIPGNDDLVDDGNNGLLVKPRDSIELTRAIGRILSDKRLADRLVDNGKKSVKGLSWSDCAQRYSRIYARLINPGPKGKILTL